MVKPVTYDEYRVHIDDVNGRTIGNNFKQWKYSIRNVGFENSDPIFSSPCSTPYEEVYGDPAIAYEGYVAKTLREIDCDIYHLQMIKEALNKPYILESQINPPMKDDDEKLRKMVANAIREYFEVNKFEAAEPDDWDEEVLNITKIVREAIGENNVG